MIIFKLIAILFLIFTPFFSQIIVKAFGLKRVKIRFLDLAFVFYFLEFILIISHFSLEFLLPYYFLFLSVISLVISILQVKKNKEFTYKGFFKVFWRIGFFYSLLAYFSLVITLFVI
ncbi:MAG: DUF3397 domain-containing protein [Streptococcus sp.]|nr:DUF3397 domain-containing protein [Streptococcus sp.]